MKNLSFVLNIVLAVAVAVLYYLHFAGGPSKPVIETAGADSLTPKKMVAEMPKEIKASKIVFVDADSLFDKYDYVKQIKKETEKRQSGIEASYKSKMERLQSDAMEFQKKVEARMVSEEEYNKKNNEFMTRKAEIENLEKSLQKLAQETQEKNEIVQNKIKAYLAEYNKNSKYHYVLAYTSAVGSVLLADPSLDITQEIVDGLNVRYAQETGKPIPAKSK